MTSLRKACRFGVLSELWLERGASPTIGIDPHKASHTAVAIDNTECVLDELRVRACSKQTQQLRSWATPFPDRVWAIESARGLDHARVLKLLAKPHRDLGRLKSKAACRLHALLMELEPGGMAKEMTVNRANEILDRVKPRSQMVEHRLAVTRETLADIDHYETQMKASLKRLRTAVAASGTSLMEIRGVGVVVAAMILGHVGDITRFASPTHFASYNGTAPIEASSGENKRHRLNQRGNRQLNWAIHIVAVTQLRYPCPGREYYDPKRAEDKNTNYACSYRVARLGDRMIGNAGYERLGGGKCGQLWGDAVGACAALWTRTRPAHNKPSSISREAQEIGTSDHSYRPDP